MTTYALSLAKAGWYRTDCPVRRALLAASRWLSYAWTSISVIAVLAAVTR